MSKNKEKQPSTENNFYKVEIIDKNNNNWYEKYSTGISILLSAILTIAGWSIGNYYTVKQDKQAKFLEIKNEKLLSAFKSISLYYQIYHSGYSNPQVSRDFTNAIMDIHVYGTEEEIKHMERFHLYITDTIPNEQMYNLDTFLNVLRNNLRKDFNLEKIEDDIFWIVAKDGYIDYKDEIQDNSELIKHKSPR